MLHFEIEATSNCNIRCLHCPHELIGRPSGRMSWETFDLIIGKIRSHTRGERYAVSFSGMGEPLLNNNIYRFVQHISGEAETAFSSNGSVLTQANLAKLIEAGLDKVYVSFNADEAPLFAKMTGGLDFEKVLANVRRAVEQTKGTRTQILANISITKANQHRVAPTRALLESIGINPVTTSLCHSRGGFLQDEEVCDTPPPKVEKWSCDVLRHTLFIDWQGKVLICAHDLDGKHSLGDLNVDSLETILKRRDTLLSSGLAPAICENCNDIMRMGESLPLASGAGGGVRDWMFYLHEPRDNDFSEANETLRWIHQIYLKKSRPELFANRLLQIEGELSRDLRETRLARESLEAERLALLQEQARLRHHAECLQLEKQALQQHGALLEQERLALTAHRDQLVADRENLLRDRDTRIEDRRQLVEQKERLQATLDTRDQDFAKLHAEYSAMRRNRLWRFANMVTNDLRRLRALLPSR